MMVKKKKKGKPKKLTKAELDFIKEYGEDNYREVLELIPELKEEPQFFKALAKLIPIFEMDLPPEVYQLYDKWVDSHPIVDKDREVQL